MLWKFAMLWGLVVVALLVLWQVGVRISRRDDLEDKQKVLLIQRYALVNTMVLTVLYFCILVFTGLLRDVIELSDKLPLGRFGFVFVLFLGLLPLVLYMLVSVIVMVPVEGKVRGRRPPRSEIVKAVVLVFLLAVLPMFVWPVFINALPRFLTDTWWKSALWFALYVGLLFALAPALFMLAGDKKPVDEPLRSEIMEFAARLGCPVRDVLCSGTEDSPPNAMVSGVLPGYRYLFVSPSLLRDFSPDEIRAVIAHEIGHIKGRHLLKNYLVTIASFVFVFGGIMGLMYLLKDYLASVLKGVPVGIVAAVFGFLGMILALVVFILQGCFATRFEYEADAFAAEAVSADAMISALRKLSDLGVIPERRDKVLNIVFRHPSIEERIERLRARSSTPQPS